MVPARLMVVDNLLRQLASIVCNFYDVIAAGVTGSVPNDHPDALGLAS